MPNRILPIRARLVKLVLASLLPAALLMAGLITYNYQRERDQLDASTLAKAQAMAGALDQRLGEIRTGLTVLASSVLLQQPDRQPFHARAAAVAKTLGVPGISLFDAQGNLLLDTRYPVSQPSPPLSSTSQLLDVFRTGKPVLADLAIDPATRQASMAVGVPAVRDTGDVAYALVAGVTPALLRDLIARQQLPPSWIGGVIDGQGTIVARTHEFDRFVGVKVRESLGRRIKEVGEGMIPGITVAGESVLSVFSRAPHSGWTMIIGIPADELTADLRRQMLTLAAGTALLLAGGLGLAGLQARAITRSVRALMSQAKALGRGEPAPRPVVEFREAYHLGLAFESAAARLAAALVQSEGRLQAVLESAMDAILAVDEGHRIVVFNAAAASLFGYSQAEALGMPLDPLLPDAHRGHAAAWLQEIASRAQGAHDDTAEPAAQARRRDGSQFPVEASVSSVRQGGETYHTVILRDITERQRTREALVRSNLDLQQFAFVASHDLRAPLRSIQGYLDLIAERHVPPQDTATHSLIARASNAARQLDGLTDDLLTYARLDTQARPMAEVDCNAVLADTLSLLDATITQAGARIAVQPLPTVHADRSQLVQVFQNLLGNALKYRGERTPEVRVNAVRGQHEWVFSVADNGIGIAPRYQVRIFEIFKRLHTQQEYAGNGIGLAVCLRVVQHHGGRIWVTSEAGQGSTFFFSIPDTKEAP